MLETVVHQLIMDKPSIRNSILALLGHNYENESIEFIKKARTPVTSVMC